MRLTENPTPDTTPDTTDRLFSTGPGGRHDWMRFHADEVPCTKKRGLCPGNLKWKEKGKSLVCDINPKHEFLVFDMRDRPRVIKDKPTD